MDDRIRHCINLIIQPEYRKEYLVGLREKHGGLSGYFSNYIPQEIIASAGFHPVRMIGSFDTSETHPRVLFNPVCSFAQDMYAAACSGGMSYLDNMIFPNSCDSLKVLHQVWTGQKLQPPAYTLLHPIRTDPAATRYFAEQLKDLAAWLTQNGGRDFDRDELLKQIEQYNETRCLLRQLYELRECNPESLTASELFTVMTAGLIMDRAEYNQLLQQWIENSGNQQAQAGQHSKRLMVIGPLLDNMDMLKKIESFRACIIADEITNGWRYSDRDVDLEGDLYENLARRYLCAGPSPTLRTDPVRVQESFRTKVKKLNLNGVIFINQKFCEPHVHNYLEKADVLRQLGINSLMLEVEHSSRKIPERDLLRLESFLEVIGTGMK
jgi:benzoyl-CoA reductase subunit C